MSAGGVIGATAGVVIIIGGSGNQIIYIPTEAAMPLLEAGRNPNNGATN